MHLIASSVSRSLAEEVASLTNLPLTYLEQESFKSGEILLPSLPQVKDKILFLLYNTYKDVNTSWMQLFFLLIALKKQAPKKIILFLVYASYCRQDTNGYTLPFLSHTLEQAGADEVLVLEPHSKVFGENFSIPFKEIALTPLFKEDILKREITPSLIVSPDKGRQESALTLASALNCKAVIMEKQRSRGQISFLLKANVEGQTCLLIDDLLDTGATFSKAAHFLKAKGALKIYGYLTHSLFTKGAFEKIQTAPLEDLSISESIPLTKEVSSYAKIRLLPLSPLLQECLIPYLKDF